MNRPLTILETKTQTIRFYSSRCTAENVAQLIWAARHLPTKELRLTAAQAALCTLARAVAK